MKKPRPTWQELPEIFKMDVILHLEFFDRCSLKQCSKAEKELVEKCPFAVSRLEMVLVPMDNKIRFRIENVQYQDQYSPKFYSQDIDFVIRNLFTVIFKHPKSKVTMLNMDMLFSSPSHEMRALSLFYKSLQELQITLKVEKLFWNLSEYGTYFFGLLEPEHLLSVHNNQVHVAWEHVLGRWRRVKVFHAITAHFGFVEEQFLSHVEKLTVPVERVEHTWEIIKSFKTRCLPIGSCFNIRQPSNSSTIPLLELFDEPLKNEPLIQRNPEQYEQLEVHTQKFSTANLEHVLLVELSNFEVHGVICQKSSAERDFMRVFCPI